MPRNDKLWFEEIEPPILTSDTVVIENYLAPDKKSGRLAASFREPHLKDIDSFKKRLAQEKTRQLITTNGELSTTQLQSIAIIEDMEADPVDTFSKIKEMHKEAMQKPLLEGAAKGEEKVEAFKHYFRAWPVDVRKAVLAHGKFFALSADNIKTSKGFSNELGQSFSYGNARGMTVNMRQVEALKPSQSQNYIMDYMLFEALGTGPDSINWQEANTELKQKVRQLQTKSGIPSYSSPDDTHPAGSVINGVRLLLKKAGEKNVKKELPKAYAAYTQYQQFVHNAGNRTSPIDPANINRSEIPLLPPDNDNISNRPPNEPPNPPGPGATDNPEDHSGAPLANLLRQAQEFVRESLARTPPLNQFRCHLQLQHGHPAVLTLSDRNNEHKAERILSLNEPDLERAIHTKKLIQSHVRNIPGVQSYHKPLHRGEFTIDRDQLIPNQEPEQVRAIKSNGVFKAELRFTEDQQPIVLSFTLGVRQNEANRDEAERRLGLVTTYLAQQREANLWVTKGDVMDHLQSLIPAGQWQTAEKMPVEGFEENNRIDLSFPRPPSQQNTILRARHLYVAGDPNPSWIFRLEILPNNHLPVGIDLNLHTLDEGIAQQRAAEVIAHVRETFARLPANAQWALSEQQALTSLTEAELQNSPNIDSTRLGGMLRDLPHYKDNLAVRIVRQTPNQDGMTFELGIIRGANAGINERVMEKLGNNPQPVEVIRRFTLNSTDPASAYRFENAVNMVFQQYLREEYRPRSDEFIEQDGISKPKHSIPYSPRTAPILLDDAIQLQLRQPGRFPGIAWENPPLPGGGRGQWRNRADLGILPTGNGPRPFVERTADNSWRQGI